MAHLPCGFEPPVGAKNIMFFSSQYRDIISILYSCARHFTVACCIRLRCKWVPGRIDLAICTICSMPEIAAGLYAPCGVKMTHKCADPTTRGWKVQSADPLIGSRWIITLTLSNRNLTLSSSSTTSRELRQQFAADLRRVKNWRKLLRIGKPVYWKLLFWNL